MIYKPSLHCHCHQPVLYIHIPTYEAVNLTKASGGLMPRPWREKIVKHVKKIVSNVRNQQSSSPVVLNTFGVLSINHDSNHYRYQLQSFVEFT